jgi:molybdate transport system substrate-binding protein
MWFRSFAALGSLAIVIAAAAAAASASEIKVLSIPFNGPIDGIGPQFERSTGHQLVVKYAPSAPLQKQIDAGEPFDVVLIFPGIVDQLIKQGKVIAGTRADIARAGLGVAIRKGAAKPDLRTTEAFKQMLLASTSIAYAAQGPSGVHFIDLLNRFGIAQDLKPKLKPMGAGSLVVGPVARGEAEIGIVSIPFIVAEGGVELAGALPRELQDYVHFSAGIGASARDKNAADAFVRHFGQAESRKVLIASGLEVVEGR